MERKKALLRLNLSSNYLRKFLKSQQEKMRGLL